jgi:hypothetical protein
VCGLGTVGGVWQHLEASPEHSPHPRGAAAPAELDAGVDRIGTALDLDAWR